MNDKTKKWIVRLAIYVVGMTVLALGLTLNTLTGLGASCMISPAYTSSNVWNLNLGNITLIWYCVFIAIQMIVRGKNRRWRDLLQFFLTFIMTRQMNFFKSIIHWKSGNLPADLCLLAVAITVTAIGAVMSVDAQLIPNPGDGICLAFSDVFGKDIGFWKNVIDITCVCISLIIGLIGGNAFIGVGIGTVCASIFTGRAIHLINDHFKEKIQKASGII